MAEKNRFSKPVAFNNKNVEDQKILKHVARRNFSGYVKKLIMADILKGDAAKAEIEAVEPVKIDEPKQQTKPTAADRLERLRKQTKRPGDKSGPKHLSN